MLREESLKEFQELCRKKTGEIISREEAEVEASKFIRLIEIIYGPEEKRVEHYN
jgi:hypothetical protein